MRGRATGMRFSSIKDSYRGYVEEKGYVTIDILRMTKLSNFFYEWEPDSGIANCASTACVLT